MKNNLITTYYPCGTTPDGMRQEFYIVRTELPDVKPLSIKPPKGKFKVKNNFKHRNKQVIKTKRESKVIAASFFKRKSDI
jgi:hypothetical protein